MKNISVELLGRLQQAILNEKFAWDQSVTVKIKPNLISKI